MQNQQAVDERSLSYPGWRVAAAAAGCVFFSFASLLVYTFGVFLKPVTIEFHWSREAASLAFGVAALCVAACSPVIGWLLDRIPARRIVFVCFTVFGLAFASLSLLTPHIWQLYATFVVLGVVGNGTAHLAYGRVISTWFEARRGSAFALLMSGGALGAMLLPVIAQSLISAVTWRTAFLVLGGSVLVIALPLSTRVRERGGAASFTSNTGGASVSEALRSRAFWIILIVLFGASLGQNGALSHLAALLSDRGISAGSAAFAVSILGGATLAGRLITGWLLDRFFAPRVCFVLLAIASLGTYLLATAHTTTMGYLAAGLVGLGMGGEADTTPYLLSRYFGLRSFSMLYGLSWTAYAIAGGVGPVIMGRAFDKTGSYSGLLTSVSILTCGTAALTLLLPRYRALPSAADSNQWTTALPVTE